MNFLKPVLKEVSPIHMGNIRRISELTSRIEPKAEVVISAMGGA